MMSIFIRFNYKFNGIYMHKHILTYKRSNLEILFEDNTNLT